MSTSQRATHVQDPLLDQILNSLGRLLRDDGDNLARPLVLEVFVKQRVGRPVLGLGLSLGRPVLSTNVLGLESGDLGGKGE